MVDCFDRREKEKMKDVITFGSAVVDVFVDVSVSEKKKELCLPVGDKILIEDLKFSIGGGGTNTGVSFSRLGLKTGFAGKIGDGHNAGIVLRELKKDKVDFLGAQGKEHTGYSVVLGGKKGNRTILTYKGINNLLKFGDLDKKKLGAKWFYFSSLMGDSFKTQERLVNWASERGIKIAYNPSSYQVREGVGRLKGILKKTDVLILNREEARELIPRGWMLEGLAELGPKIVCITLGKEGVEVYDGVRVLKGFAHKDVKCVERTGAGDAFASGFVAGLVRGKDVVDSIKIGSANAEGVIQKPGAKNGLLSWGEAVKKIKRGGVRVKEI
jgi:ribokinase